MMKRCSKCGIDKDESEFYKSVVMKDGLQGYCKDCKRITHKEWQRSNPDKANAINQRWRKANPERERAHTKKWQDANPEKVKAIKEKWRKANKDRYRIKFVIDFPQELSAGFCGFTDVVTIAVRSGDPGGEPGEFEQYIRSALSDWYDGANINKIGERKQSAQETNGEKQNDG
jgi:hypothetical protein